jgi:hypothetical protein
MKKQLELRIELIDPMTEKGVYKPGEAKRIDYIIVNFYDFGFLFFRTLIQHVESLLTRNGILPED